MKKIIALFRSVCTQCFGSGTKETGDGYIDCPACKGKGIL